MSSLRKSLECAAIVVAVLVSGVVFSTSSSADETSAPGTDLTVTDVYWVDMFGTVMSAEPAITSGQPYTVCATVFNSGTVDAPAFSTDMCIDGISAGEVSASEGLAAQEEVTLSWTGIVTSEVGNHDVTVAVDPADLVFEENSDGTAEVNNERTESLEILLASWTLAVYLDADNNLEVAGNWDFLEMASVGTTREVNVVVQLDRSDAYDTDYGNWTDAKRFLITQGMEPYAESAYEDLGEVNMGSPDVLADFASHSFTRFRAAQTFLVLWDHGMGWFGGCCRDESALNDSLKTDEMRNALITAEEDIGTVIDIIGFDACLMASVEVCYAFEGLCIDFIASEAMIAMEGWPYDDILETLVGMPSMAREDLCELTVSEFCIEYESSSIATLSAFDVEKVCDNVTTALSEFGDALLSVLDRDENRIRSIRNGIFAFDLMLTDHAYLDTYSADLYTFARDIEAHIKDELVKTTARNVMTALEDARISFGIYAGYVPYGEVFGIVVFWPEVEILLEEYQYERLALDTSWDEFLLAYYS